MFSFSASLKSAPLQLGLALLMGVGACNRAEVTGDFALGIFADRFNEDGDPEDFWLDGCIKMTHADGLPFGTPYMRTGDYLDKSEMMRTELPGGKYTVLVMNQDHIDADASAICADGWKLKQLTGADRTNPSAWSERTDAKLTSANPATPTVGTGVTRVEFVFSLDDGTVVLTPPTGNLDIGIDVTTGDGDGDTHVILKAPAGVEMKADGILNEYETATPIEINGATVRVLHDETNLYIAFENASGPEVMFDGGNEKVFGMDANDYHLAPAFGPPPAYRVGGHGDTGLSAQKFETGSDWTLDSAPLCGSASDGTEFVIPWTDFGAGPPAVGMPVGLGLLANGSMWVHGPLDDNQKSNQWQTVTLSSDRAKTPEADGGLCALVTSEETWVRYQPTGTPRAELTLRGKASLPSGTPR